MLEGSLNQSEFFTALRSLSFHKRQGVLEVCTQGKEIQMLVVDGVIVEVRDVNRALSVSIVAKLKVAGILNEKIAMFYVKSPVSVSKLEEDLVDGNIVNAYDFARAKTSYELDLLYSMRSFEDGNFVFTPGVVRLSHDYNLNISPGHLMLDLVEMNQGDETFNKKFGEISDINTFVSKRGKEVNLIEDENVVLNNISDTGSSLKSVYNSALLCEKELRLLLISLFEREVIEIDAPHLKLTGGSLTRVTPSAEKNQSSESVDEYISSASSMISEADSVLNLQTVVFKDDSGELVEATEAEARDILGEMYQESLVGESAYRVKKNQAWRSWAEGGRAASSDRLDGPDLSFLERLHNAVIILNYKLIEESNFKILSLIVVLTFFLFLALMTPSMLSKFTSGMEQFSSALVG